MNHQQAVQIMAKGTKVVLVIEDEAPIRRFLKVSLTDHEYIFREALSGREGLSKVVAERPDIVILDLGLPDMDGLEVVRQLREWTTVPIIILSARGQEKDKVEALDAGADDYLTKPFGVAELLARIRVALRNVARLATDHVESVFSFGEVHVDLAKRRVFVREEEIHLTRIEYKLLITLIKHAGKVVTHNHLLKEVWGQSYEKESNYLRVYMSHLRRKLESDPAQPKYLITEVGVGFRLQAE